MNPTTLSQCGIDVSIQPLSIVVKGKKRPAGSTHSGTE
jgi:hypothetical protein